LNASLTLPGSERLPEPLDTTELSEVDLRAKIRLATGSAETEAAHIGRIIDLPRIPDQRGNLTFVEENRHVPFDIRRVFYLYDVPGGAYRGGHAHKQLHQLVIAMAGSFDVLLDNGHQPEKFSLNRAHYGLHIPPMTWGQLDNFSSGAVCLVLASENYDEADYFRDYSKFKEAIEAQA
jgi:hypothetical protein